MTSVQDSFKILDRTESTFYAWAMLYPHSISQLTKDKIKNYILVFPERYTKEQWLIMAE